MRALTEWSEMLIQCVRTEPDKVPLLLTSLRQEASAFGYQQAMLAAIDYATRGTKACDHADEIFTPRGVKQ